MNNNFNISKYCPACKGKLILWEVIKENIDFEPEKDFKICELKFYCPKCKKRWILNLKKKDGGRK